MSARPLAPRWTPLGAASPASGEAALDAALFARVRAGAEAHGLGPEHLALAFELAAWQEGLAPDERRALFLLTAVTLLDQRGGSTHTPIAGADGARHLAARLAALLPDAPTGADAPAGGGPGCSPAAAGAASPGHADAAAGAGELPDAAAPPLTAPQAQAAIEALLATPARLARVLAVVDAPGAQGVPLGRPLVRVGEALYHQRTLAAEVRLAGEVRRRLETAPTPAFADQARQAALSEVLSHPPANAAQGFELAPEQLAAVEAALARPLAVVSGGAGTGKTSVVLTLLRLLVRLGITPGEVALAAPTGKAGQRLRESLEAGLAAAALPADGALATALARGELETKTLHRLLGSNRRGTAFRHGPGAPLEQRVVIVDEASMIELDLFDRLLGAVRPGARLVLLGDADQLPAVGAGTVLRDLVPPPGADPGPLAACAVRLTRSFRMDPSDPQGSAVLALARAVQSPDAEPLRAALTLRAAPGELTWQGAEALLSAPDAPLGPLLEAWFRRHVASLPDFDARVGRTYPRAGAGLDPAVWGELDALFAHYARARILCPTRAHRRGVHAVNAALHTSLAILRAAGSRDAFLPGEPVLATANDYDKGLFNGDQGLVLWVAPPDGAPRPQAVFRTQAGYRSFSLESLAGQLEHAFATTVHKAQGSEFDHVALVLPERDTPLLTREVLYTAVSRARRSVAVCGAEALLEAARGRAVQRHTGLAGWLTQG